MSEATEAGFDGVVEIGTYKLRFRHGFDILQLKEFLHKQPKNQFFWCEREQELLYRNKEGEFFKMSFEKIEL